MYNTVDRKNGWLVCDNDLAICHFFLIAIAFLSLADTNGKSLSLLSIPSSQRSQAVVSLPLRGNVALIKCNGATLFPLAIVMR